MRQVLFVQGGGKGTHDAWDNKLVESLERELGGGYQMRYPRMPDEDDPKFTHWKAALRKEFHKLDDGGVLVGHSIGAAILVHSLADESPESRAERESHPASDSAHALKARSSAQ